MLEKGNGRIPGQYYASAIPEHWIMGFASYQNEKYLSVAKQLFAMLAEDKDYKTIVQYAGDAIKIERGNSDLYYWSVLALNKTGGAVMARKQMMAAKEAMTAEDYAKLEARLNDA